MPPVKALAKQVTSRAGSITAGGEKKRNERKAMGSLGVCLLKQLSGSQLVICDNVMRHACIPLLSVVIRPLLVYRPKEGIFYRLNVTVLTET